MFNKFLGIHDQLCDLLAPSQRAALAASMAYQSQDLEGVLQADETANSLLEQADSLIGEEFFNDQNKEEDFDYEEGTHVEILINMIYDVIRKSAEHTRDAAILFMKDEVSPQWDFNVKMNLSWSPTIEETIISSELLEFQQEISSISDSPTNEEFSIFVMNCLHNVAAAACIEPTLIETDGEYTVSFRFVLPAPNKEKAISWAVSIMQTIIMEETLFQDLMFIKLNDEIVLENSEEF